jgi:hypothetical protein
MSCLNAGIWRFLLAENAVADLPGNGREGMLGQSRNGRETICASRSCGPGSLTASCGPSPTRWASAWSLPTFGRHS